MKKILLTASTAALLCGCGGPNYSITGNAGLEPGDSVFLIGQLGDLRFGDTTL